VPATTVSADLVRILQGAPDDAELAALVAVLAAVQSAAEAAAGRAPEPPPAWSHPLWGRGVAVTAGRDAWRMSGLPR